MTSRVVEPEWLDELPSADSAARRSRADLRRLNGLMGHAGLITRELRRCANLSRLCDLGSGDGSLMLRVARRLDRHDVELNLIDRAVVNVAAMNSEFAGLGWSVDVITDDVFNAMRGLRSCDAITANLFLHHFQRDALRELLDLVAARTRCFIACEPRRSPLALLASRSLGIIGCSAVTRHDAVVSVRAGFRDAELSALWPQKEQWQLSEKRAGLFTHLFVARKL